MKLTKELLLNICQSEGYCASKNLKGLTLELLCTALSNRDSVILYFTEQTGCSKQTITDFLRKTLPDRDPQENKDVLRFLLSKIECKFCSSCEEVLLFEEFNRNATKVGGLADYCRICAQDARRESYRKNPGKELLANATRKHSSIKDRTPIWASKDKIAEIYKNCPEGCQVDHEIPLHGLNVSGLNIETNLQYLTEKANLAKGNSFDIEKFSKGEVWYDKVIPDSVELRKTHNKEYTDILCPQCNNLYKKEINSKQICCSLSCGQLYKNKNTFEVEFIQNLIWSKPFTIAGKEIGMSDTGLKKMAKRLGCIMPPPRYHNKSLKDKEMIYKDTFKD